MDAQDDFCLFPDALGIVSRNLQTTEIRLLDLNVVGSVVRRAFPTKVCVCVRVCVSVCVCVCVRVWSCVVTPQIRKGSRTQRQIQGTKHLFIIRPRRTGDDQFLPR